MVTVLPLEEPAVESLVYSNTKLVLSLIAHTQACKCLLLLVVTVVLN
jgi:hypothetical protein